MSAGTADIRQHNERVARAFLDGMAAQNESAIGATLAENAVFVFPRPSLIDKTVRGGSQIAAFLANLAKQAYAVMSPLYGAVLATETGVCAEWRLKAKTTNGQDYDQFYCWVFDIADGKITEIREYIDTAYGQKMNAQTGNRAIDTFAN